MGIDLRPTCAKCGKVIEAGEMRAVGGMKFNCVDCYENKSATTSRRVGRDIEPISKQQFFSNKEYICDSCGFQFSREPTKHVSACPYCGKKSVHEKIDEPASDFIE